MKESDHFAKIFIIPSRATCIYEDEAYICWPGYVHRCL